MYSTPANPTDQTAKTLPPRPPNPPRDPSTTGHYNALIKTHITLSRVDRSLSAYLSMVGSGVQPDRFTFPLLFKACSAVADPSCAAQAHARSAKAGLAANPFVSAALLHMYMKRGAVSDARRVFDAMPDPDAVAWNALLSGYSRNRRPVEALDVFRRIICGGGEAEADRGTAACALMSCAQLGDPHMETGRQIHSWVAKNGFDSDMAVATTLLHMYAESGDPESAIHVFESMTDKDLIAWNCLIACSARHGLINDAFDLFVDMQRSGRLKPNASTLAGLLPAVAHSGSLHSCKSCHAFMVRNGIESIEPASTALMDAYAKCGDVPAARALFDAMREPGVVAWSSIIAAHGIQGLGGEALSLFEAMKASGVEPNRVTYLAVLSACAHAGLVERGRKCFRLMEEHGIAREEEHYACMVDMLGRAGLFEEAMRVIGSMRAGPSAGVWEALLGGCRMHGKVALGEYVAGRLFGLGAAEPGLYVLLSNIYASAGLWAEVGRVRALMRARGLKKEVGWSSVEVRGRPVRFVSGDSLMC